MRKSSMRQRLHGALGALEHLGGLLDAHVQVEAEDEHLALTSRQRLDLPPDLFYFGIEVGPGLNWRVPAFYCAPSMQSSGSVHDHDSEVCLGRVQVSVATVQPGERVMNDVLGVLSASGEQPGEAHHRAPLGPVEGLEVVLAQGWAGVGGVGHSM